MNFLRASAPEAPVGGSSALRRNPRRGRASDDRAPKGRRQVRTRARRTWSGDGGAKRKMQSATCGMRCMADVAPCQCEGRPAAVPRRGRCSSRVRRPIQSRLFRGFVHEWQRHVSTGRCFAPKTSLKVLGIQVDGKGSTAAAIAAREQAATGVWFHHLKWLTCRRVPQSVSLKHLYATAGAAFLCWGGGWKLSTSVWRQCVLLGQVLQVGALCL